MSERTDEALAGGHIEHGANRPEAESDSTVGPGISPALIGNTTDIASRDWTGLEGEPAGEESATPQHPDAADAPDASGTAD